MIKFTAAIENIQPHSHAHKFDNFYIEIVLTIHFNMYMKIYT